MSLLTIPLRSAYRCSRRLGVFDAMWLLHASSEEIVKSFDPLDLVIRHVEPSEMNDLCRAGLVHDQVAQRGSHDTCCHSLICGFLGQRVVSFLWLAEGGLAGDDNFSRTPHLGASVMTPATHSFVYNAWTDADQRGKRLLARLTAWAIENHLAPGASLSSMVDWTNDRSRRAFENLGMKNIGLVVRSGRGAMQLSLIPTAASRFGLTLASDAPGWKFSY